PGTWEAFDLGPLVEEGSGGVSRLAFSADGVWLVAGGHSTNSPHGGTIWVFDMDETMLWRTQADTSQHVLSVAISPDGVLMAVGGVDVVNGPGAIRLYRLVDGLLLAKLEGHAKPVQSLAFSPDGTLLVSGAGDGLRLWGVPE
ncbi:MAG: hypothetical protein GYB65_08965, partial [Chloroflexi bacterium]|nr:hypothetical protein [Chloroflexota bacterium]